MPLPDPPLPSDFQFSQNNLQDFLTCPRRFQLKYLLKLAWPAVQSEPVIEQELAIARGAQFHQLAHQYAIGVGSENLANQISDPQLSSWWQSFVDYPPRDLPAQRKPEYLLAAPMNGFRVVAKYDLLAYDAGGKFIIIDWKTNNRRPKRLHLQQRVQTRLYQFLLTLAGAHLNSSQPVQPGQIQMLYWFTADPTQPEVFEYNPARFREDEIWLKDLIDQIITLANAQVPFPLVLEEKACAFCSYRSLCNRGVVAGNLEDDELVDDLDTSIHLDFEQIGEIAF